MVSKLEEQVQDEDDLYVYFVWTIFTILYVLLAFLYLLVGVRHRNKLLRLALKCLPILTLFFFVLLLLPTTYTRSGSKETSDHVSRAQLFLWGLIFSCIGDGCLVVPKLAVGGVLAFAVAICLYTGMFALSSETLFSLDASAVIVGLPIALFLVALLYGMFKYDIIRRVKPLLLVLLCVLICLLSLMLWVSFLRVARHKDLTSTSGAVGAILFFISDLIVVASTLLTGHMLLFMGRLLIMGVYYCAQLLIALSL